jgi:phenylalanyl-tRNA synthetase beta chain
MTIRKSKIRGQVSLGMLCSESELGLAEQSKGIMVLPKEAPIGMSVWDYLNLDDYCLEVALTPNRGDCLSIAGLAREIAALSEQAWQPPYVDLSNAIETDADLAVKVSAQKACPRYLGRVIENINPQASTPLWLKERLRRCGLRSVDAVVDVTNYVMLELGQPLHAFDAQHIEGSIEVRFATAEERLTLLNEEEKTLTDQTLVISDAQKALALAGIMGGKNAACQASTTTIFLESAFFTPEFIQGRARAYGLHTDSSHRFERGVDPQIQKKALERATELLLAVVGGQAGPLTEVTADDYLPSSPCIELEAPAIGKLLGAEVEDVAAKLQRLGMQVTESAQGWQVKPPSFRFDIHYSVDLIEELVRLAGYDHWPTHLPQVDKIQFEEKEAHLAESQLKQWFNHQGYQEIYSYSFVDPKWQRGLVPQPQALALKNPLAGDMAVMRTSLWPGLLKALQYNQKHQQKSLRLFEVGACFQQAKEKVIQEDKIAAVIAGSLYPEQWNWPKREVDFYDIKGDLEGLMALLRLPSAFQFQAQPHEALHTGQSSEIFYQGQSVGWLGALHPQVQKQLKLAGPIMLFELSLQALQTMQLPNYSPIVKLPSIRRDLAVIVDKSVTAAAIEKQVRRVLDDILTTFWFFDVYEGDDIPVEKKSLGFAFQLQHSERTLTDAEANDYMQQVIDALYSAFQATLRGG